MDPLSRSALGASTDRPSDRRHEVSVHHDSVSVHHDSVPVRRPTFDDRCVVCGSPVGQVECCCSLSCAETAQRELRENATRLRRLPRHPDLARTRHLLAERNGQLSSALMRWRPSARPAPEGA